MRKANIFRHELFTFQFGEGSSDCCAGGSRERAADRLDKFIFHVHKFSLLGTIHF